MVLYLMVLFIILTSIFLERTGRLEVVVFVFSLINLYPLSLFQFKFDHLDVVCIEIVFNNT